MNFEFAFNVLKKYGAIDFGGYEWLLFAQKLSETIKCKSEWLNRNKDFDWIGKPDIKSIEYARIECEIKAAIKHIHFEVLIYEHDHIGIPCVHKCSFSFVLTTFLQEFEALIDKQLEKQAIRQVEEEDSQIYKQRVNKARKQIELELNVLEPTGELHGID